MFHYPAKFLVVVLVLSCMGTVSAQTSSVSNPTNGRENNPYSKFGIGQLWNGNNTVLRGMANASSAFESPYEVNADNPASYSFLQRTTFEMGATASNTTLVGAGERYKTGTVSVSYMNLAVPAGKNAGLCLGFRPVSRTYYNMADTVLGSPIGKVINSYNGEGNMNYAYVGAAGKYKELSVGFNLGYMFGNMRNSTTVLPVDTSLTNLAYAAQFNNYTKIGGLYWKGGVMYEHKIDSEYTLRIGGTLSLKQSLTERLDAYQVSTYNFGDTLVNDTVSYPGQQRGKLKMPLSYSIGVMLVKNDKWGLGLDYTGTQWSGFSSSPDSSLNVNIASQSYKVSLGGEYTPNVNDIRNYFSRVTYRFGLYYGSDYLKINNTTLPYYGLTAGASLPFKRSLSRMHVAFDVGRLGVTTNNLIQETYVRFSLGISFNDKWFIPRKYD